MGHKKKLLQNLALHWKVCGPLLYFSQRNYNNDLFVKVIQIQMTLICNPLRYYDSHEKSQTLITQSKTLRHISKRVVSGPAYNEILSCRYCTQILLFQYGERDVHEDYLLLKIAFHRKNIRTFLLVLPVTTLFYSLKSHSWLQFWGHQGCHWLRW